MTLKKSQTYILTKEPYQNNIFQQRFDPDIKPEFRTTSDVYDKYSKRAHPNPFFTGKRNDYLISLTLLI